MSIPFLDLKAVNLAHADDLQAAFKRVLESGWYILGKEVEQFEQRFAAYCEAKHGIGVANGLDAIMLALKGYGIKAGDEIVTTGQLKLNPGANIRIDNAQPLVRPEARPKE